MVPDLTKPAGKSLNTVDDTGSVQSNGAAYDALTNCQMQLLRQNRACRGIQRFKHTRDLKNERMTALTGRKEKMRTGAVDMPTQIMMQRVRFSIMDHLVSCN